MNKYQACWLQLAICLFLLSDPTGFTQPALPLPPPVPAHAISFWPLETLPWESSSDKPARAFTNLNVAASWDYAGTTLSVDTNVPAFLQLDVFESGKTNVTLNSGSLEIWCQANWTSVADGGTGPGAWATLWDIGAYTHDASIGAWLLTINPTGSNLVWLAQADGSNQALSAGIDFDAGDWHQIVATWSATNACLYVDGELTTNAGPIQYQPSSLECSNDGFCVGSLSASGTNMGTNQFHGQLQWLASYAQPLSADDVAGRFTDVADYIANFGYSAPGAGGFHSDDNPILPGGGGTNIGGSGGGPEFQTFTSPAPISSIDYAAYNEFYLTITNDATNSYVSISNTLSNITYIILTNDALATTNWKAWQTLLASNAVTPAPPLALSSNGPLFFEAIMVSVTGTNGLPDWWQMRYFSHLNVDPYADPDGDLLCNLDEYILGTNPTNANSISSIHKDAEALVLAFTNYDSNCAFQLSLSNGPDTNFVFATITPTQIGTNYQIYSHNVSDTNNTWIVETNFLGTNASTTVAIQLNGRTLCLVGGYGEDSDGDGLSDGYEVIATWTDPYISDTGNTGIGDGSKDPDGDGYSNVQECQNETNPHVFNAPTGPVNPVAETTNDGNGLIFSWQPSGGPVQDYVISAYNNDTGEWDIVATTSATQTSYTLAFADPYILVAYGYTNVSFTVQASYPNGLSLANLNNGSLGYPSVVAQSALAHGPGGNTYFLVSTLTSNIAGYTANSEFFGSPFPEFRAYGQSLGGYIPSYDASLSNYVYIPSTQLTNGIGVLTDSQEPRNATVTYDSLEPILSGGSPGNYASTTSAAFANVPFIDGSVQLKQNVRFLFRIANGYPFSYILLSEPTFYDWGWYTFPTNYVFSSYYNVDPHGYAGVGPFLNHYAPFEDNYFFRNFVFDDTSIDINGTFDNGFSPWQFSTGPYEQFTNIQYQFDTYGNALTNNGNPISDVLSSNNAKWVGFFSGNNISDFGAYESDETWSLSNFDNLYGLPYSSLKVILQNNQLATLSPSETVPGFTLPDITDGNLNYYKDGSFYAATVEPMLQTIDYYFCRPFIFTYSYGTYISSSGDPLPGYQDGSFSVTNKTPQMIDSVGQPMLIAGYAKQTLLNGYTNTFAYLGQYFSNALVMSNGFVTTNSGGVLSEYGEFFPTVPGQIALQTMPDPDQANTNGTCIVNVIRLSLDVNHDGVMDETYTGPDNTSAYTPFVFWVNNDNDGTGIGQDVNITAKPNEADYTFGNIRSQRNLEDFARLWMSGLPKLPTTNGYSVTLSISPSSGNPAINLYASYDTNGSSSYLSDTNAAAAQFTQDFLGSELEFDYSQQLGTINSNQSYNLPISTDGTPEFTRFLFEGAGIGAGQLTLTVAQTVSGVSNMLAQTSAYIDLHDIKDLYERATIQLDTSGSISNWTSTNYSIQAPTTPIDTDTNIIVLIHGINVGDWDWISDSETVFKRLYWAGYRGEFATVKWPCEAFKAWTAFSVDTSVFNRSEIKSYKCASALKTYLNSLKARYPDYRLNLLVHSQGNAITGEAIEQGAPFDTYILTEGAIPASAYDFNTSTNAGLLGDEMANGPTPDLQPMGYHGVYTNMTGHIVNFYNPYDPVLGVWLVDQAAGKPDGYAKHLLTSYFTPFYGYEDGEGFYSGYTTTYTVTDPEESRAMISRSRTESIGRQGPASAHGIIQAAVNLNVEYGFGNIFPDDHSAQWVRPIQVTLPYFQQVLFQIQPTP